MLVTANNLPKGDGLEPEYDFMEWSAGWSYPRS